MQCDSVMVEAEIEVDCTWLLLDMVVSVTKYQLSEVNAEGNVIWQKWMIRALIVGSDLSLSPLLKNDIVTYELWQTSASVHGQSNAWGKESMQVNFKSRWVRGQLSPPFGENFIYFDTWNVVSSRALRMT